MGKVWKIGGGEVAEDFIQLEDKWLENFFGCRLQGLPHHFKWPLSYRLSRCKVSR